MLPIIKIVVTGVTGGNGWETFSRIARFPFVKAYGLVRKAGDVQKVWKKWADFDQGEIKHFHHKPIITNRYDECSDAFAWISFKGLSLGKLQQKYPDLEAMANKRGLHRRDLLLEENLQIYLEDIQMAHDYSPGCIYIPEGNPLDIFVRLAVKMGFPAKHVISSGERLGSWRFNEIFNEHFPGCGQSENSILYLGEHGEKAVPIKSRFLIGGVRPEEYLRDLGEKYPEPILKMILDRVNTEAFEIQQATGETPHYAPGAVTADTVRALLNSEPTNLTVSAYIENNKHYGVDDVAMTMPVSLGSDGILNIHNLDLTQEEHQSLRESADHIKQVNALADQMMEKMV